MTLNRYRIIIQLGILLAVIISLLFMDNFLYDGGRSIIDWKKLPFHITPKFDEMKNQLFWCDESGMSVISPGVNIFSNDLKVSFFKDRANNR